MTCIDKRERKFFEEADIVTGGNMLTTKQAIEERRSIRKFKPDDIPDHIILELLDAARLAPSGCNAQPWRFKLVKDTETRNLLAEVAYHQKFIASAPVVIVCCADLTEYLKDTVSGVKNLGDEKAVDDRIVDIMCNKVTKLESNSSIEQVKSLAAVNTAIAIEHIILRALDFGLGSCWVRLLNEEDIRRILHWNDNYYVVAILPIGYPDEAPKARKRKELRELLID